MESSEGPPPDIRWPFEFDSPSPFSFSSRDLLSSRNRNDVSNSSPQTDPASLSDEEGVNQPSNSSSDYPVESESANLAFVGQHPNRILQAGEVLANTSSPKSASPQVVAAPVVTSRGQSVQPGFTAAEELLRLSTYRASLTLPRVSVKSRIAAFENQSPTAQTFGSSPPRQRKVTPVSHSFALSPEKREKTARPANWTGNLDLSETGFPPLPTSIRVKSRGGFGPIAAESGVAAVGPSPPAVLRKECTALRESPQSPLRGTVRPSQAQTPSPDTEHPFLTPSIDWSKLPEKPRTLRLDKSSAIPIRSKSVESERPFSEPLRPRPRLQVPSFSWRFPPGDPFRRVKRNDVSGPRPRPEDAPARHHRYKPHSSLLQDFRAESSEGLSPRLVPAEPSLSVDENSSPPSSVPESQPNVRRSSPTRRDCAVILCSPKGIEFTEEQIILLRTTGSLPEEDCGRSTVPHSQIALVLKHFRPYRPTIARPEAKDTAERTLSSADASYVDYRRRSTDADHLNLSNFSFSFNTTTGKHPDTFRKVQHKLERNSKPALLPLPFLRLRYDNPPSSPELPDSEARAFEFSVPTLEEASVSDFKRPSRRRAATLPSHSRHLLSFGPYTEPFSLGPRHQLHSFRPILSEGGSILPLESDIKPLQHQRKQRQEETGRNTFWKAPLDQGLWIDSSTDFLPDPTEGTTKSAPKAGAKHLETPISQEPEEPTPRITRSLIQHRLCSSDSESESDSCAMDRLRPESALAVSQHRREAMRLAKAQETSVIEKCRRSGASIPEYTFDELIGKGSFGRVYKCRNTKTRMVVAVKVIDIDESDYRAHGEEKDEQIRAFQKEIKILRQAQESGAPNLNQMIEALPVHSQLWLVCEYCPGGSVKTLMRATNDKLVERYIVVIARELAKALTGLHAAGILHRDIKAANVLIHEEGRLQLCDFGVATIIETKLDKRRTFIGTLHWMPPELWDQKPEYSDEVDVWAFGCTIYECAMGKPPNSDLREPQQLKSRMRRLNKSIELPESGDFPEALRSLVSYTLTPDARNRPSMRDVLNHKYLADTEESHPTSILTELVNVYYTWLHGGGQRASLFIKGGAAVSDSPGALSTDDDEWNFSTTIDFEKRISSILDIDIDIPELNEPSDLQSHGGEATPKAIKDSTPEPQGQEMTEAQKANFEARVRRGADLSNVFDLNKPNYEYKTKTDFRPIQERRVSDLPLRVMAEDRPPSIASNEIDLGDFDSSNYATVAPLTKLIDASTIRAKRGDLKLSRESSSNRATPNINVTTGEDDYPTRQGANDRPATQDFSFPPKEWEHDREKGPMTDLPRTDDTSAKTSVRKTMDWSFDTAMSETEPEEPEPEEPETATVDDGRAKKHDTMQWSFGQAMAEAGASSTAFVTTARPAPLLRTTTMPVTSSEVDAAEADVPRPSTAMSEAASETSLISSEADPFGLDQDALGYPVPSAFDKRGISSYYHSEGDVLSPEHTVPYNTTIAGPVPYHMGPPARMGEESFPGPSTGGTANPTSTQTSKKQKMRRRFTRGKREQALTTDQEMPVTSSSPESASPGTPGARQIITMPEINPPSVEALDVRASPEQLERELGNMLGSFGAVLTAAGRVMGISRRSRRGSKRSSSEWESEE